MEWKNDLGARMMKMLVAKLNPKTVPNMESQRDPMVAVLDGKKMNSRIDSYGK